jgi:DNA-binding CsgD family transcriptional regulator
MMLSLNDREMAVLLSLGAEVAGLPMDKGVRRRHIIDTLRKMVGGVTACCFEGNRTGGTGLAHPGTIIYSDGAPDHQDDPREQYYMRGMPANPAAKAILAGDEDYITQRRSAVMDDATWYGSEHFHAVARPLNLDDSICSRVRMPDGTVLYMAIHREIGDEPFTERDCQWVQFFNVHASKLYHVPGKGDPVMEDPRVKGLAPRLRPVLAGFLDGDGEKQVATKLGLSPHTVHQYAKLLYRHFAVSSRGELLSQFIAAV